MISIKSRNLQYQKDHYLNFVEVENKSILKISKILRNNKKYNRYEANIIEMNGQNVMGKVLLNTEKDSLDKVFNIDELLYSPNQLKEIRRPLNPYEFDYKEYLKNQQIVHRMTLGNEDFKVLGSGETTVKGIAHSIRARINVELKKYNFSKEELSIVNALLLGQRRDISKVQFEQYRDAGAIHILAVSGLHIGIILLFLNFLFQPLEKLKNGKLIKLIIIIACLWTYALLAGLSASIIRSVAMFTAISIGMASDRPTDVKNSLIISLFFLLLLNPFYLFDVGFQLSYTAVFSIFWLQPFFYGFWRPKQKLSRYFWNLITVTFAAQLGILPLTLFYFHQFPGLFFVSSLIIIPFLGILLGFGFLIIFLALMHILPQFLANIFELTLRIMNDVVAFISFQEYFILKNISMSIYLLFSSYALILCSVTWLKGRSIKNLYFLLISILIVQINLTFEKIKIQKSNQFIVFHQSKNTIIGNRTADTLEVFKNDGKDNKNVYHPLNAYKNALSNLKVKKALRLKNVLKINSTNVLIIDSSAIYNIYNFNPEIVLLINSPKINLDRMIDVLHPKTVIADGSNYRSYALKWGKSCMEKSVQFHNTSIDGAFVYNYSP
jgi:competence protein ComEC